MIIIPYNELKHNIVFIEDYYDIPLKGTCKYQNRLAKFRKMTTRNDDYEITELSLLEKVYAKLNQWAFEICVGTHWSFNNGKVKGQFTGFTPLSKLYYWFKGH